MIYSEYQNKKISKLALGMMRLPTIDGNESNIDEEKVKEMVKYAIDNGVNYFDTAFGYHNGNSEIVAGNVLSKYDRESFFLASKFPGYDNSNMPKVKEIFEKQLEKCQTKYFDFYMFHNVYEGNIDDYLDPKFGIYDYLMEQKKNGRIKHLGFSIHGSIDVMKRFLDAYGKDMEFCQIQLNYMDWNFQNAKAKVALLSRWGIPVWVMEPVRGGKLAKATAEMEQVMKELRPDASVVEWAFRFIQSINEVTVTLSGMSNMEQLKENIDFFKENKPLSNLEFEKIVEMADIETAKGGLPCTGCRYCTSYCPNELPIPELISLYNEHKITGGGFIAPMTVGSMPEDKRPKNCISCGSCENVCPQQIKISEMMSDFSKMIKM